MARVRRAGLLGEAPGTPPLRGPWTCREARESPGRQRLGRLVTPCKELVSSKSSRNEPHDSQVTTWGSLRTTCEQCRSQRRTCVPVTLTGVSGSAGSAGGPGWLRLGRWGTGLREQWGLSSQRARPGAVSVGGDGWDTARGCGQAARRVGDLLSLPGPCLGQTKSTGQTPVQVRPGRPRVTLGDFPFPR